MDVNIKGFEELEQQFEKLKLVAQRAALIKAVRAGADPLRQEIANSAPKDEGGLANDIVTQLMTSQNSVDSVAIRVGPSKKHFYGSFTDRGTKFIHGTHWMMDAFHRQLERIKALMGEVLRDEISKGLKR